VGYRLTCGRATFVRCPLVWKPQRRLKQLIGIVFLPAGRQEKATRKKP
jgi:hypothetical protein